MLKALNQAFQKIAWKRSTLLLQSHVNMHSSNQMLNLLPFHTTPKQPDANSLQEKNIKNIHS